MFLECIAKTKLPGDFIDEFGLGSGKVNCRRKQPYVFSLDFVNRIFCFNIVIDKTVVCAYFTLRLVITDTSRCITLCIKIDKKHLVFLLT